ncbi:MAG: uracil-DNA glycosylase family protein [Rhodospirillales bacterium]
MTDALASLSREIAACTICAEHLPLGPRPVTRLKPDARLLIIGQAPGTKVHETGIPWNDPSGDRLRGWLGVDRATFYDSPRIAIMPMGFCYPGRLPKGGDAPPRPECAEAWHGRALDLMKRIELTLLVGTYAQGRYLPHTGSRSRRPSMTPAVENWREYGPGLLPLPHPSWRTTGWQKRHPWFDRDVLPVLRDRVHGILHGS